MNPRKFIHYLIFILMILIFSVVFFNYFMNDYGLFDTKKEKRIYLNEKNTKYLLSLNHISNNYRAILVGPSLSDNINTNDLKFNRIYNLSMAGANISELKIVIENVVKKKKPELIIFCLDPFLIKDVGIKSMNIIENPRYKTLFSINAFKLNLKKIYYMIYDEKDNYNESTNGTVKFSVSIHHNSTKEILKRVAQIEEGSYNIVINKNAILELRSLTKLFNDKNIKTIFYLHPIPYSIYSQDKYTKQYQLFRTLVKNIIGKYPFYDFNTLEYIDLRKDDSNYLDSGHLSDKGVKLMTVELNKLIKENIK